MLKIIGKLTEKWIYLVWFLLVLNVIHAFQKDFFVVKLLFWLQIEKLNSYCTTDAKPDLVEYPDSIFMLFRWHNHCKIMDMNRLPKSVTETLQIYSVIIKQQDTWTGRQTPKKKRGICKVRNELYIYIYYIEQVVWCTIIYSQLYEQN